MDNSETLCTYSDAQKNIKEIDRVLSRVLIVSIFIPSLNHHCIYSVIKAVSILTDGLLLGGRRRLGPIV